VDAGWPTPTYIRNYQTVLAAYGYWPSFHDAPLLSFIHSPPPASTVDLSVHVFELTHEVNAEGFFIPHKHHVIRFVFYDVEDVKLRQFDVPNTLFEMCFSPPRHDHSARKFTVGLSSVLGGDCVASFAAGSGEVLSVIACDDMGGR
jgi:hypothetical protein